MLYCGNKDEQDSSLNFRNELIMKIENSKTKDDDSITSLFGVDPIFLSFLNAVSMNEQEKALQRLYNSIYHKEPRKFDPSSPEFYVREDKLNQYMNYFTLLLDSETTSEQVKELAIRLIILVANIKSSGEDYLIAYNYISSRKWKINLHAELSLNPYIKQIKIEEANDQSQSELIKIEPDGNFSVIYEDSKRIKIINDIEQQVNWSALCSFAFGEDYFYMFIRRKGLFKVGLRNSSTVTAGKIYKYRKLDIFEMCSLAFVNGVLYLRQAVEDDAEDMKNIKPLEVIDQDTLDFIENEQIKERIIKTKRKVGIDDVNKPILEQSDPTFLQREIGNNTHNIIRHVLESSIFTDGVKLYLHSYNLDVSEGAEKLKFIQIESYNADTWEFISSIKLDFKPANVNSNDYERVKQDTEDLWRAFEKNPSSKFSFSTNCQTLMIHYDNKLYLFDMATGVRHKEVFEIQNFGKGIDYDYKNNVFWVWEKGADEPTLKSFKIKGFQKNPFLGKEALYSNNNNADLITKNIFRLQKVKRKIKPRSAENFLRHLELRSPAETADANYPENDSEEYSLYLLMFILKKGCENVEEAISLIERLDDESFDSMFKYQARLYRGEFGPNISTTFVKEVIKCIEKYSDFVSQEMTEENLLQQYQFMWVLEIVKKLFEVFDTLKIQFEQIDHGSGLASRVEELVAFIIESEDKVYENDKIQAIWKSIFEKCVAIQGFLYKINPMTEDEVTEKINNFIKSMEDKAITLNTTIFAQYLSTPENMKKFLDDPVLFKVFDSCCEFITTDKDPKSKNLAAQNALSSYCSKFIRTYSTMSISEAYSQTHKEEQEGKDGNRHHLNNVVNKIYERLVNSCIIIAERATKVLTSNINKEEKSENEEQKDGELSGYKIDDTQHYSYIELFDVVNSLIFTKFSECNDRKATNQSLFYNKTIELAEVLNNFEKVECSEEESKSDFYTASSSLFKPLSTLAVKFLSHSSYNMVRLMDESQDNYEKGGTQYLLQANIFSGGIQDKFLNHFNEEAVDQIKDLAVISNDLQMIKYIENASIEEEDKFMKALIYEGTDNRVDALIDLLQWDLLNKNPAARAGGKKGMTVVRCAFAANLALNRHNETCKYANLVSIVDQIEMFMEDCEEDMPQNQRNKDCIEELQSLGDTSGIFDRWKIANKMRIWLQEKQKDISEQLKKKLESRNLENNEDSKEETKTETQEIEKLKDLSEEDILKMEQEDVENLIKKVCMKAEFLMKLATPKTWKHSDFSEKSLRQAEMANDETKEEAESTKHKLRRIKTIQASKGTVTNYENISNKEIFSTCSSSVLAVLQCSDSAEDILKVIGRKYVNAMNRYCGFRIMAKVLNLKLPQEDAEYLLSGFCNSLRKDQQILAHYSDGLAGIGDTLLKKLREGFYFVCTEIIKKLKDPKSQDQLKVLLGCLQWKIGASDHKYILDSGIIQLLKNGNGLEDKEKNLIKYSWNEEITFSKDLNSKTVSHLIIDSLEFMITSCFSRILEQGKNKDVEVSISESSVSTLKPAQSIVTTDVTQILIQSCLEAVQDLLVKSTKSLEELKNEEVEENNERLIEESKEEQKEQIELVTSAEKDSQADKDLSAPINEKSTEQDQGPSNPKVTIKLLRLLNMLTSISLKNDRIKDYVKRHTKTEQISKLITILLKCSIREGTIVLAILSNFVEVGISIKVFDIALKSISTLNIVQTISKLTTKSEFPSEFLQLMFNLLLQIRSDQWREEKSQPKGKYSLSCGIVRFFKRILRSDQQLSWRDEIEQVLDDFLIKAEEYSLEEFDATTSLFEGGEYLGMTIGSHGVTEDDQKFTIVGFIDKWGNSKDSRREQSDFDHQALSTEYILDNQKILAIPHDEDSSHKNVFLCNPDEVTLIPNIGTNYNDFLLDSKRLTQFIKVLNIQSESTNSDSELLTKKCIGMKILLQNIQVHGNVLLNLLDKEQLNNLLEMMLKNSTKSELKEQDIKYEFYEQKLYCIKSFCTLNQNLLTSEVKTEDQNQDAQKQKMKKRKIFGWSEEDSEEDSDSDDSKHPEEVKDDQNNQFTEDCNKTLEDIQDDQRVEFNLSQLEMLGEKRKQDPPPKNKYKAELYRLAYTINPTKIPEQYKSTLLNMVTKICYKTTSEILQKVSMEDYLTEVANDEEKIEIFAQYLLTLIEETIVLQDSSNAKAECSQFFVILDKILKLGVTSEKIESLLFKVLDKVIIIKSCETLNKCNSKRTNSLTKAIRDNSQTIGIKNISLLPEMVAHLLNVSPSILLKSKEGNDLFNKLLNLLLLTPLILREEVDFGQKAYMATYNIILQFLTKPDQFSNMNIIEALLNHKLMKKILKHLPKTVDFSDAMFTDEQKILFEIFCCLRVLEQKYPNVKCSYTYPEYLLEIEKYVQILKETNDFNLLSYLLYFEKNGLAKREDNKIILTNSEENFDYEECSKYAISQCKKISIALDKDSEFAKGASILFSKDPEGKLPHILIHEPEDALGKKFDIILSPTYNLFNEVQDLRQNTPIYFHNENAKKNSNSISNSQKNTVKYLDYSEDSEIPKVSTLPEFKKGVKLIAQVKGHALLLTEKHQLYRKGNYFTWPEEYEDFTLYPIEIGSEIIVDVKASYFSHVVLTRSGKFYFQGVNNNNQFNEDEDSVLETFKHKPRPHEDEEQVAHFDIGPDYIIYTTTNGKCYASGKSFLNELGESGEYGEFKEIKIGDGLEPIKPFAARTCNNKCFCIMLVKRMGRNELWSYGMSSTYLLGQGNVHSSNTFSPLDYDKSSINFIDVSVYSDCAMAVTDDGRLFGWGSNKSFQLGITNHTEISKPVEIPFFKNYYTKAAKCGKNMAIIHCIAKEENKHDLDSTEVGPPKLKPGVPAFFVTGEIANNKGIVHCEFLDGAYCKFMEAAENQIYFCIDEDNQKGVSHHGYVSHSDLKLDPITGTMHFWRKDNEWVYASKQEYAKLKEEGKLPDVCYATKKYIEDIPNKKWLDFNKEDLLDSQASDDIEPIYLARFDEEDKKASEEENKDDGFVQSNETDIFEKKSSDIKDSIYFRIGKPLKNKSALPIFKLEECFGKEENPIFKINITPDYGYEKNDKMIQLNANTDKEEKKSYERLALGFKEFSPKLDKKIMQSIDAYLAKNNMEFTDTTEKDIKFEELIFENQELKGSLYKECVEERVEGILRFNKTVLRALKFYISEEASLGNLSTHNLHYGSVFSEIIASARDLTLDAVKYSYIMTIRSSLRRQSSKPTVEYSRIDVQNKKDQGLVDERGRWTIFSTTMKKCRENGYRCMRVRNSESKAWNARFVGEGSVDQGGPYRETISNITDELQSQYLPLLIPTQNNKNDHGFGRDLWTINPQSNTKTHMRMYKFFGALLGMAFRAGQVMDIELPSIFWKKFTGEEITLEDLEYSDAYAVQVIKEVEDMKETATKEEFEEMMELTWTTQLSNGDTIPLCSNGEDKKVLYEEVDEYHKQVIKARIDEFNEQFESIREGFDIIFPTSHLRILNWRFIELKVTGPTIISTDDLKSITYYSDCNSENEFVERFWRVFDEFTNQEKSMFLKFTWGRARLPPPERLNDRKFKLMLISEGRSRDHDTRLPEAHTCFFQFDLPRYSKDEICKERILYAIQACGGIDTDCAVNQARSTPFLLTNIDTDNRDYSDSDYSGSDDGSDGSDEEIIGFSDSSY
ncbi:unnamed protein product [Moneuplotes crassus]|uniref:HECT domain-containing protein n=1 Tax=Euplotes crassus TaxID=5936 RepID=A0AAD1U3P2_EUPCR|nr:unnamed protein product [Moneuplotes crassus]